MAEKKPETKGQPIIGLCATCVHMRLIKSDRGSIFYQCSKSLTDPSFPKYPRLPVLRCVGYELLKGGNTPDAAIANPVIVVDYDSNWPRLFQSLRKRIADALGDMAAAIEHVGSTAVPGLAAKAIIDIDVLLASETMLPAAIERLASLGYIHRGNLGVPEREAFFAPADAPPHHLYLCPPHSAEFCRHMAFRDYLRTHPKDAKIYGDLKFVLAERFREDRPGYNTAKGELVVELTRRAIAIQKK